MHTHGDPNDFESDDLRLSAVRRYNILDTPPDGAFDRITKLAADLFDVPIALVSIVDEDRIWFKSRFGLDNVTEIARAPGLCASAIFQDAPYIVNDASLDVRTLDNPLVADAFGLRFYAAAPLKTHDGHSLGTLCVVDRKSRSFSPTQAQILETLAKIVMDEMELRLSVLNTLNRERQLRELASAEAELNRRLFRQQSQVAGTLQKALLPRELPNVPGLEFSATYIAASAASLIGGDWYDVFLAGENHVLVAIGDVGGHGLNAAVTMSKMRQSLRILAHYDLTPSKLLQRLDTALVEENDNLMVTLFIGILDIESGIMRYSSAGHPPPMLRHPHCSEEHLELPGAPLGIGDPILRSEHSLKLERGTLLVLYTDGVTEATRDVLEGEARLRAAINSLDLTSGREFAAALREQILPEASFDDVAILTVHRTP